MSIKRGGAPNTPIVDDSVDDVVVFAPSIPSSNHFNNPLYTFSILVTVMPKETSNKHMYFEPSHYQISEACLGVLGMGASGD